MNNFPSDIFPTMLLPEEYLQNRQAAFWSL